MGLIAQFQKLINDGDIRGFIILWEKVSAGKDINPYELLRVLLLAKGSSLAGSFGEHADKILPIWRGVQNEEESYAILKALVDLQTTDSKALAEAALCALKTRYGDDPKFEDRIQQLGLLPHKSFQGALSKYELLRHLKRGNLVIHTGRWGRGEIRGVLEGKNEVAIEFENLKRNKRLSIESAIKVLAPLESQFSEERLLQGMQGKYQPSMQAHPKPISVLDRIIGKIKNKRGSPSQYETPLTAAVINNDIEQVKALKGVQEEVIAKNFLGFNGIEIAKYLDREACLEILEPQPKKTLKVKPKGSSEVLIFSQKEFQRLFKVRYLNHLIFGNYQLFQKALQRLPTLYASVPEEDMGILPEKLMKYAGKPALHQAIAELFADKIACGYHVPVRIEWISEVMGYGAFAERVIKKGEYIGEYIGEFRPLCNWSKPNDYSIIYPGLASGSFRIDPTVEGNELRFFNHSYEPNTRPIPSIERGLIHCTYIATKEIPIGTQLTWNYGEQFWAKRTPPI